MSSYVYYLHMLQQEMHSVVFATINEQGRPVTCAIDLMLADENGLYFLTAKGKSFYTRLNITPFVSVTGIKGEDTMSSQSISLHGQVREIGKQRLHEIFAQNPYMAKIYPDEKSRSVLTVFQLYQGVGEFFDLSVQPIFREVFSFGGEVLPQSGYFVQENCIGCKLCYSVCPQHCIDLVTVPVTIEQEHCLKCGRCLEICPKQAIEKR